MKRMIVATAADIARLREEMTDPSKTPRTDEMEARTYTSAWEAHEAAKSLCRELELSISETQSALETERLRLAACSTAALGYFDGCKDEYRSAALDDVLDVRKRLEEHAAKLTAERTYVALETALGSLQEMLAKQLVGLGPDEGRGLLCAACGGHAPEGEPEHHAEDCIVPRGLRIIDAALKRDGLEIGHLKPPVLPFEVAQLRETAKSFRASGDHGTAHLMETSADLLEMTSGVNMDLVKNSQSNVDAITLPRVPTPEMLDAFLKGWGAINWDRKRGEPEPVHGPLARGYAAMIEAAPGCHAEGPSK